MTLIAEDVAVRLGSRLALAGVTLRCAPGRITGLVGPNGAGKSTLLKALAGLLPVAAGTVRLDGDDVAAIPARLAGRRIAYLPQDRVVHWPLAARSVVALGRLPHQAMRGAESSADREAIGKAMHATDVAHLAGRAVNTLSGGELARVLVARALAQEAAVVLADEPTAGLDPAHALALFEVLTRLAAEGRTLVVALHDLSLAARFCHDVMLLKDGAPVGVGTAADMLTADRLTAVFGVSMGVARIDGVPAIIPVARRGC